MIDFKNALFVSIEGQDGSGKDTLVEGLTDRLERAGYVIMMHTTYYNFHITRHTKNTVVSSSAPSDVELNLAISSRFIDLKRIESELSKMSGIKPDYSNVVILANRYTDSTYAYQCYTKGKCDDKLIDYFYEWNKELGIPVPNATVYISCPPEILKERLSKGRDELDGHETQPISFFEEINRGFIESFREIYSRTHSPLHNQDSQRDLIVIDGTKSIEDVLEEAYVEISKSL